MGCGILAFTILLFTGTYIHTETVLIPHFIVDIFFVCSLLTISKRYKTKKLILGLSLSILSLLMYFVATTQLVFTLINIVVHYFQIYMILKSIIDIANDYEKYRVLKKKTTRYLINITIINALTIYYLLSDLHQVNDLPIIFIYILIIQSIGLCRHIALFNNYLYGLEEPIKIERIKVKTLKKKIIAIIVVVTSICCLNGLNEIIPWMIYKNEDVQFECYVYNGRSENIIIDSFRYYIRNKSPYYGDMYRDNEENPVFYIKKELFEKTHVIESAIVLPSCTLRCDILVKDLNVVEYIEHGDYVGVYSINNISGIINDEELENDLIMRVKLLDENYELIKYEAIPITRQECKEYGYSDKDIDISHVYVTDTSIVYGPYIYIKNKDMLDQYKDLNIYTTFVVDGKEIEYSKSDSSCVENNIILSQKFNYAPFEGKTISLRIHFTDNINGKELFFYDYKLEETK